MSYVTGSHALKAGFTTLTATQEFNYTPNSPETYTFFNQVPIGITEFAWPDYNKNHLDMALGLFAQDNWTIKRMTLNLGVRFDYVHATASGVTRPAGFYCRRSRSPRWRMSRTGRTSTRGWASRTTCSATGRRPSRRRSGGTRWATTYRGLHEEHQHPSTIATAAFRTWSDTNGNFVPDCKLHSLAANGECGALSNQTFGSTVINTNYADDVKTGWGHSPYLWEGALSVQQELRQNVGVTVGYYRTWAGNLYVTDNLAVTPADYTAYCVTAPVDARLPGGGGYPVTGLYDVSTAKFGQVNNLIKLSSTNSRVFNGVDFLVNARFGRGGLIQGGVTTGKTRTNLCDAPDVPSQFCDTTSTWGAGTQVKLSAVYPLPIWGLQASATYQNLPGRDQGSSTANSSSFSGQIAPLSITAVIPNAQIAPSLGRNLSSCPTAVGPCTQTVTVSIVGPYVMVEPRANQLDIRLSKIFKLKQVRLQANFDIYNLTNASDVLALQNQYGPTFLNALNTLPGRLFKFGAQVNF